MKLRIRLDVTLVIIKEIQLDVLVSRTSHKRSVKMIAFWGNLIGMRRAVNVLPFGCFKIQCRLANILTYFCAARRPILTQWNPELVTESSFIRIAVLCDNGANGIRSSQGIADCNR